MIKEVKELYGKKVVFIFVKLPIKSILTNGYFSRRTSKISKLLSLLIISPFALLGAQIIIPLVYWYHIKYNTDYAIGIQYHDEIEKEIVLEHELMHLQIEEKLKTKKNLMELLHRQLDEISFKYGLISDN